MKTALLVAAGIAAAFYFAIHDGVPGDRPWRGVRCSSMTLCDFDAEPVYPDLRVGKR